MGGRALPPMKPSPEEFQKSGAPPGVEGRVFSSTICCILSAVNRLRISPLCRQYGCIIVLSRRQAYPFVSTNLTYLELQSKVRIPNGGLLSATPTRSAIGRLIATAHTWDMWLLEMTCWCDQ